MLDKEKIVSIIRMRGPTIPKDLMKTFNTDTFMIGAALSELAKEGRILISHTKIGGSPFYYVPEQKERLQEISRYLNDKDKKTYELLKERKVIKDIDESPLTRVSLRNIKDYAKPIEVKTKESAELFWKWYMLSNEQAGDLIRERYFKVKEEKKEKEEKRPELKKEIIEEIEKDKEEIKEDVEEEKKEIIEKPEETQQQAVLSYDIKDDLLNKTKKYLNKNNIVIKTIEIIRKNREIDCIIAVPSPVGEIDYYCKVKDKKRCNDGDLASVFVKAQMKKLPALFITTGEVTKKAKEMLDREFKNMKVINIS